MADLAPQEITALRDLLDVLTPNLALAFSEQINREVILSLQNLDLVSIQSLLSQNDSALHTVFALSQPVTVDSVLLIPEDAAQMFVDLIDGNDGSDPPMLLTDAHTEKLSVAMNGVIRGLATALTNLRGESVDVEAGTTSVGVLTLPPVFALEGNAARATISMSLPDLLDAEIKFLFTPEFARALSASETKDDEGNEILEESEALSTAPADAGIISEDELAAMLGEIGADTGGSIAPTMPGLGGFGGLAAPPPSASPFGNFAPAASESSMPRGMELVMDIPLDVTVELGRVRMLIKDVLELASGSIVELDRVAGEPVDLLVNGRLIAKGEVVVIEDNFGIRITEIISPADRVAGLGKGR